MAIEVYGDARSELALWSLDTVSGAVGKQLDGLAVIDSSKRSLESLVLLHALAFANLGNELAYLNSVRICFHSFRIIVGRRNHSFGAVLFGNLLAEQAARNLKLVCVALVDCERSLVFQGDLVAFSEVHHATRAVAVSRSVVHYGLLVADSVYIDGRICDVNRYVSGLNGEHSEPIRVAAIGVL